MPVLTQLLAFVAVALVVICTPGPDTALTVRNVLAGGRRPGSLPLPAWPSAS